MPAIAKAIHREGTASIQSYQPYMAATATHCHSPKKDERKNKCLQACVPGGKSDGSRGQAWADRITCPKHVGGCFAQAPFPVPPHTLSLTNTVLGASSYLKVMVPKSTNVTFQEHIKMGIAMVSKLLI
jgi:hypothetical protein